MLKSVFGSFQDFYIVSHEYIIVLSISREAVL